MLNGKKRRKKNNSQEAHPPDKVVEVATGKGDLAPSCTDLLQATRHVVTKCHSDISCLLVCLTAFVQLAGQEQGTNEQAAVSCDVLVVSQSKRPSRLTISGRCGSSSAYCRDRGRCSHEAILHQDNYHNAGGCSVGQLVQ
jgi:hypothetical protein